MVKPRQWKAGATTCGGGFLLGKLNIPSIRMTGVSDRSVMNIYSQSGCSHVEHKHNMVIVTPFLVIKHPYPIEKWPML